VAYDWRPTATRSATTDPSIVVVAPRHASVATPAALPRDAMTVGAAIDEFVEAAQDGRAPNRSGRPYKPSALRDLRGILEYHVAPELGDLRLRDVRREHVQALVDRLGAERLSESRIRSVISALRALYGYAIEQRYVEFNPADALVMPRIDELPGADELPRADEPARSSSWTDRLDELWQDPPRWDDRPAREARHNARGSEREPRTERAREPRSGRRRRARSRAAYEPIALLPERILSFALRIVFVLFVLILLVSLLESA
jgi:Phage integrase, N-terminal SAM-like domain